jgi:protein Xni
VPAHVVLIDALNLIRRIYAVQERPYLMNHNLADSTKQQVIHNTIQACQQALIKMLSLLKPTHGVAVFDSLEPCWRYQLFADYKKGRSKMPDHLAQALSDIQDGFLAQGIDSVEPEQDEADDVIATLAVKVALHGQNVTIVSTDKSFLSLLGPHIHVFDYFNRRFLDTEFVKQKFNVLPWQLVDYWTLTGDSTNKIPGVPSIGAVTAAKLLKQYRSLKQLQQADDVSASTKTLLTEHKAIIERNQQLLTLKQNIPLGFNLKDIRLSTDSTSHQANV